MAQIFREKKIYTTEARKIAKEQANGFVKVMKGFNVITLNIHEWTRCKSDGDERYLTFLNAEHANTIFGFLTGGKACTATCTAIIEKLYPKTYTLRVIDETTKKWSFLQNAKFPSATAIAENVLTLPESNKGIQTKTDDKKETKKMAQQRDSKNITEPSLAKRQAELKEIDGDIEVIDETIKTMEESYKGVYNAWCVFDEGMTEGTANSKMYERLEAASTLNDAVFEELKALRKSKLEARKTIQTLVDHWEKREGKAPAKAAEKPEPKKAAEKPEPKKAAEKPEPKKAEPKKAEPKKTAAKAGDKDMEQAKKINEFIGIFVPELKSHKVRVTGTQKATAKRNGLVSLSKGREVEITKDE